MLPATAATTTPTPAPLDEELEGRSGWLSCVLPSGGAEEEAESEEDGGGSDAALAAGSCERDGGGATQRPASGGALYLGEARAVANTRRARALRERLQVKRVLNCAPHHIPAVAAAQYMEVDMNVSGLQEVDDVDKEKVIQTFEATHAFIRDGLAAGETVLVHCVAGMDRSATVLIAFLMKEKRMDWMRAMRFVSQRRHISVTFHNALSAYEAHLSSQPSASPTPLASAPSASPSSPSSPSTAIATTSTSTTFDASEGNQERANTSAGVTE